MKTNPMIYICYMFCIEGVEICVLTVRDNEHDSEHAMGDDKVMSSDVPGEGTARETLGSYAWTPPLNSEVGGRGSDNQVPSLTLLF